jgi:hypothetical protein
LRDQLCLLIRKYELDPTLVKRYAADFCGAEALRDASRDLVEAFISTLAEEAAKDRAALICKLNSYNQLAEVKSWNDISLVYTLKHHAAMAFWKAYF